MRGEWRHGTPPTLTLAKARCHQIPRGGVVQSGHSPPFSVNKVQTIVFNTLTTPLSKADRVGSVNKKKKKKCNNLGELNFHMENGLPEAQKLPNRYYHMSRSQENWSEFFFVHYWGCGRHFSGGDRSDLLKRGELLHLWFCLSLCKMSNLAP